eukprot:scaffold3091_cov103-Skeletonema_marinoi.AAC.5
MQLALAVEPNNNIDTSTAESKAASQEQEDEERLKIGINKPTFITQALPIPTCHHRSCDNVLQHTHAYDILLDKYLLGEFIGWKQNVRVFEGFKGFKGYNYNLRYIVSVLASVWCKPAVLGLCIVKVKAYDRGEKKKKKLCEQLSIIFGV